MESVSNRPTESANGSYPRIAATATALPPYTITREDVKVYMGRVFDIPERRLEAMMSIVDNAQVHNRHSIFPLDYTIEPRPLSRTNNEYIEHAVKLGREAAEKCLERAGLKPADIDMIITVSCTGFMIPSLDAHLINLMGFRSNVRRHGIGLRRRRNGAGTRCGLLEGGTWRKRLDHRRGVAFADVSAQGHFASQPHFFDPFW